MRAVRPDPRPRHWAEVAGVADREHHRPGVGDEPYLTARRGVSQGVVEQISQHLRHPVGVGAAASRGPAPLAWQLADALTGYFRSGRHPTDWLATA
jgi:hypothetical protein